MAVMEGNLEAGIENGNFPLEPESSISTSSESDTTMTKICDGFPNFDGLRGEGNNESNGFVPKSGEVTCKDVNVIIEKNSGIECRDNLVFDEKGYSKQKLWKPYSNKHSKPPRPPKGPLLNASDMMLVKKISEIAVKKRERIERIRALKKMKGAKSLSSGCNIVSMILTVLFFIFIIIQGLCSRGGIQVGFQGSPEPSIVNKGIISVQLYSKPPANEISRPINRYRNSDEPTSGSGPRVEEGRDVQ